MSAGWRHARDTGIMLGGIWVVWFAAWLAAGDAAITPPGRTFERAFALLASANFWGHARATFTAFAFALVISSLGGVGLGLLLGPRRFAGQVAEPMLTSLYTIPKVTLYPVMLLLFGLGMPAKVAFGVIHGIIPVTLFTLAAIRNLPPVLLRSARAMRLSPMATATHVLAPAVWAEIATGLRIGFALTFLGVLIGEMFASQRGLGFLIINGINAHDVALTIAVTLIVVVVAVVMNAALLALDRRD
jgi:NitT/TauT family transport system permease protein